MVKLCNTPYSTESKYDEYFALYPYPLSDFQKYAIEAIVEGHHVLVTAHTGSGKTLPAEFAINHFTTLFRIEDSQSNRYNPFISAPEGGILNENWSKTGKKVIYTSPIKALSNQKYYEFTQKYPHISFGLFTGDIKTNPDADVLIMTTEILMNSLFTENSATSLQFQINIHEDLACVIFDEVHYINDEHRGQVWEKCILMLPQHIQMVMLSATIDAPVRFATWCQRGYTDKEVYLASTNHRVVPLSHYGFLTTNESFLKGIKDKELQKQIRDSTNKLILLQNEHGKFNDAGVLEMKKTVKVFDDRKAIHKRKMVLNNLSLFLRDRDMLPAIAFVFSRKHVELSAKEITVPLLEDDSKVSYIVRRECEQIIRKLPNFHEYLELPEYNDLVDLLEKGIGIHHSGMIPILREIVELMISKKYIKILFATESFAIGLDCPIKTAIFTGLMKFDGCNERYLLSHEYTQMAGRAGRRGIDTIGHVVHCNNLFDLPIMTEYKNMLCGTPQKLVSKFRISYALILNLLKSELASENSGEKANFVTFASKSMVYDELQTEIENSQKRIDELVDKMNKKKVIMDTIKTPNEVCRKYLELENAVKNSVNKKKREIEKEMQKIREEYCNVLKEIKTVTEYDELQKQLIHEREHNLYLGTYISEQIRRVCYILTTYGYMNQIQVENSPESDYELTHLGKIAASIAEIHPLIFSKILLSTNYFQDFTSKQLIGLFSCFTDVKVDNDQRLSVPKSNDSLLETTIQEMNKQYQYMQNIEITSEIHTGIIYEDALIFDIIDDSMEWCECANETECKIFIQTKIADKGISVGDFTKSMLKIATIVKEISGICEEIQQLELLYKLNQIEPMILKYITTSQSLYV
jgi:superfamily II RNA helicase